jgi:hypothetical protein
MKKIIYLCTFICANLCVNLSAFAQKIKVSSTLVSVTVKAGVDDAEGHFDLTNISTTAQVIRWERTVPCVSNGWLSAICDEVCWIPDKSSNEFTLEAGKSIKMIAHVYPDGQEGSAIINLKLFTVSDPAYKLDVSLRFNECKIVGTNDREIAMIQLSPNPAQDVFRISENTLVRNVTLVNALGQVVTQYNGSENSSYDVSHVAKGLYFVHLSDENGKLLKTEKLIVE